MLYTLPLRPPKTCGNRFSILALLTYVMKRLSSKSPILRGSLYFAIDRKLDFPQHVRLAKRWVSFVLLCEPKIGDESTKIFTVGIHHYHRRLFNALNRLSWVFLPQSVSSRAIVTSKQNFGALSVES